MILITLLFFTVFTVVYGGDGLDQWWYTLGGDDSPASNNLAATSLFYNWFKTGQHQFEEYAPASHVGKINRGTFLNPELNLPAHRAFGRDSDFNAGDMISEAFSYKPRAQNFVANKIHVDAGLAKKVGQIASMPVGVFVQDDGTLLVDTSMRQANPCDPSPCSPSSGTPRCLAVSSGTAKCIGPERKTLELKWVDPVDETKINVSPGTAPLTNQEYVVKIQITPDKNCQDRNIYHGMSICGATISTGNNARGISGGKVKVTLEPTSDGAMFKDYTYAVYAVQITRPTSAINNWPVLDPRLDSAYNLGVAGVKLSLYGDINGVSSPELFYTVPQGSTINPGNKQLFFFGCIRPSMKGIDTRGAGFYRSGENVRGTTGKADQPGLCDILQNVVPAVTPGFM